MNLKKPLFIIGGIVALAIAYYLLSPLFTTVEVDDVDPLADVTAVEETNPTNASQASSQSSDSDAELDEIYSIKYKEMAEKTKAAQKEKMADHATDVPMKTAEKPRQPEMKAKAPAPVAKIETKAKDIVAKIDKTEVVMDEEMDETVTQLKPASKAVIAEVLSSMEHEDKMKMEEEMEEVKKQEKKTMKEPMPTKPKKLAEGVLKPHLHEVAGKAVAIQTDQGKILRIAGFESVIGPETYIYLSTSKDNEDFKSLGLLKANKGNINYFIPDDVDIAKYDHVLIWCRPFGVLFSYGVLK